MGTEVANPLRLKRRTGGPVPPKKAAKPKRTLSENALIGMGLWFLLWSGYNTDMLRVLKPNFPANTMDLIHGVRSFFPMLAGWFSCLLIFARVRHVFYWIIGPLGLILFYAFSGLISSATISVSPILALYYGINYLSIVLVLLAIVLVADPLPDLLNVLRLTWTFGIFLTLALLGAIPILGSQVIIPTEGSPFHARAYSGTDMVMGMASSRNTGFARYAAISALAALPGFLNKGNKKSVRLVWAVLLIASLYALVFANGRTETVAFIGSLVIILAAQKTKRFIYFLAGTGFAIILGLRGFYTEFFLYFTRGKSQIDLTFTGRTLIWERGWKLLWQSPWLGFGFQADRLYLDGWSMSNAFLHALVQSGIPGGGAVIVAMGIAWYYTIHYFFLHQPADKSLIPAEIPAIFLFTTVSSLTESTFSYYCATWLLSAPIIAYVMALHRHMKNAAQQVAQDREQLVRLARRKSRVLGPPVQTTPSIPVEGIQD